MGDKNQIKAVTGTDVLCKTGHGILKAIYVTDVGDYAFTVRDGTSAAGTALFTMTAESGVFLPYINTPFNTGLFIDNTGGANGAILVIFE